MKTNNVSVFCDQSIDAKIIVPFSSVGCRRNLVNLFPFVFPSSSRLTMHRWKLMNVPTLGCVFVNKLKSSLNNVKTVRVKFAICQVRIHAHMNARARTQQDCANTWIDRWGKSCPHSKCRRESIVCHRESWLLNCHLFFRLCVREKVLQVPLTHSSFHRH